MARRIVLSRLLCHRKVWKDETGNIAAFCETRSESIPDADHDGRNTTTDHSVRTIPKCRCHRLCSTYHKKGIAVNEVHSNPSQPALSGCRNQKDQRNNSCASKISFQTGRKDKKCRKYIRRYRKKGIQESHPDRRCRGVGFDIESDCGKDKRKGGRPGNYRPRCCRKLQRI